MTIMTTATTPIDTDIGPCAFKVEDLGLWTAQSRPPFPPPPGECQSAVPHGDIDDTGSCHVKVFRKGQAVHSLGIAGTFRLVRVTGTPEQISHEIAHRQQSAAQSAGMPCPIV